MHRCSLAYYLHPVTLRLYDSQRYYAAVMRALPGLLLGLSLGSDFSGSFPFGKGSSKDAGWGRGGVVAGEILNIPLLELVTNPGIELYSLPLAGELLLNIG